MNKSERKEKQKKRRKEARKITQGEGEDDEGKGKKKLRKTLTNMLELVANYEIWKFGILVDCNVWKLGWLELVFVF